MTKEIIQMAQEYLTVSIKGDGKKKKIVDIDHLLKTHSPEEITNFLNTILMEKQKQLKDLILQDKTRPEIDETVAEMFRITLAVKIIEGWKEVRESARTQRTAGGSS